MARKKDSGKPAALSQEYIIDSDSDGVAHSSATVAKSAKPLDHNTPRKKKPKKDRTTSSTGNATQTESLHSDGTVDGELEDVEASPSSSESGSNEEEPESSRKSRAMPKLQKKQKTASTPEASHVSIPARPFRPPHGFHEVRAESSDISAEALETLTGGLAGKQVWHITAPASIPLDAIKEFNVDAVRNGNPILTHSERQYGFASGPKDVQEDLLLPGGSELTYKRLRMSISKSYHLQEIPSHSQTGHPASDQSSKASHFFANEIPVPRTPPKQPEVLKMRYKPFGIANNSSTATNLPERLSPEQRELRAPPQPSSQLPESTPKKRKKHKRPSQSKQNGLADDPMEIDGTPTQATIVREPSSQTELPFSELPARANSIDERRGTPGKKKKKKKFRDEQSS